MSPVNPKRCLEERNPPVELLHTDSFVTTQRVSVCTSRIKTASPSKTPHGFIMLFLKRKGVPGSDPSFGSGLVDRGKLLGKKRQHHLIVEVPEKCGEQIHVSNSVWFYRSALDKRSFCLRCKVNQNKSSATPKPPQSKKYTTPTHFDVLDHLKVAPTHHCAYV